MYLHENTSCLCVCKPYILPTADVNVSWMVKITSDNFLNTLLVCAQYVFSDVGTEFVNTWILRLGGLIKFLRPIRVRTWLYGSATAFPRSRRYSWDVISCDEFFCSALTEVSVPCCQPSQHTLHFAIAVKFVTSKIFLQRWKHDNYTGSYLPFYRHFNLGSSVTNLCAM